VCGVRRVVGADPGQLSTYRRWRAAKSTCPRLGPHDIASAGFVAEVWIVGGRVVLRVWARMWRSIYIVVRRALMLCREVVGGVVVATGASITITLWRAPNSTGLACSDCATCRALGCVATAVGVGGRGCSHIRG